MATLQLWDDLEEDFLLYGIQSNGLNEAKFVFQLNQVLSLRFNRVEDLDAKIKSRLFCFSLYQFYNEIEDCDFYLIKNQSHTKKQENTSPSLFGVLEEAHHLLNNYKIFDYFIKIPLSSEPILLNEVSLRSANFIQNFSRINNLTNKERKLLFI